MSGASTLYRGESTNTTSLTASYDISVLMSREWLAFMGSQCRCCDAHSCNCSANNQPRDVCHGLLSSECVTRRLPCHPMHRGLNYIAANSITRAGAFMN
jgi:hypothetical protein